MTMFVSLDLALNDFSHLLGYFKSNKAWQHENWTDFTQEGKLAVWSIIQCYNLHIHYVKYEWTAIGHVLELSPKTISKQVYTLHNSLHSFKIVGQDSAERCQQSLNNLNFSFHFPLVKTKQDVSYELQHRLHIPHLLKHKRMASYSPGSSLMIFTAASSPVEMLRACRIQTQVGKSDSKGREREKFPIKTMECERVSESRVSDGNSHLFQMEVGRQPSKHTSTHRKETFGLSWVKLLFIISILDN